MLKYQACLKNLFIMPNLVGLGLKWIKKILVEFLEL
jgi:hypothetical protein